MNPSIEIREIDFDQAMNCSTELEQVIEGCDAVVTQKRGWSANDVGSLLAPYERPIVSFPRIYFEAFHPDLAYVRNEGKPVKTPLDEYNSKIILFAYLRGLSADQTEQLFTASTYATLEYFNVWAASKKALFDEFRDAAFEFDELFHQWSRSGCFMHSVNHPKLAVLAGLARTVLDRLGIRVDVTNPEDYLSDELASSAVWPVYPEIAALYGFAGHHQFKLPGKTEFISLSVFISGSFDAYAQLPPEHFQTPHLAFDRFGQLFDQAVRLSRKDSAAGTQLGVHEQQDDTNIAPTDAPTNEAVTHNPYRGLAPFHFWRRSVQSRQPGEIDPVAAPRFVIGKSDRVASAGSCFAQHITRELKAQGFRYYVVEQAPLALSPDEAAQRGFGVFSARFGNIYTARQLVQLFDRAYGEFLPEDNAWQLPSGSYVDPFRPQIEPDGFRTIEELEHSRESHLAAVRRMFERLDLLVFTLGLTESWYSRTDGAVFPLAPGVVAGNFDREAYGFVNFSVSDVTSDLNRLIRQLRDVNPQARLILTVSPVPLVATYEDRHVIQATTYSKSVLRVACETIRKENELVEYFPSYEIITGHLSRGQYFEEDGRTVKKEGVEHVMRLFRKHFTSDAPPAAESKLASEMARGFDIVCDEQRIEASV